MTAPVDLTRAPDPSQAILATVAAFRANERAGDCDYGANLLAFLDRVRDLQDRKDGVS